MSGKIIDVSDSLNYDSNKNASQTCLNIYKEELYCAWTERGSNDYNQIKMKKYDGNNCIEVSSCLNYNENKHAQSPCMQVYKDELYCAWQEANDSKYQIKIKKYNGTSWINISSCLNYDSNKETENPCMQVYKDELYCAWYENYQIKVKKYNGSSWTNFSECLNYFPDKTANYPVMEVYKDELCFIWIESDKDSIYHVRIRKYNGTYWTAMSHSSNYDSKTPHMQVYKDELYWVLSEVNENSILQIKMIKISGKYNSLINNFKYLNFDSSKDAYYPYLQVYKDELYCVWCENNGSNNQIKMKKYDGNSWSDVSDCLNYTSSKSASNPVIQVYKDKLYCTWQECDMNGICQIKMKKYYSTTAKFLIKQNDNYISIKPEFYKNGQYQPLTLEGDLIPNDSDFVNNGFDDLDELCAEVSVENNIVKVRSNASDYEEGKIFSFNIDSEFKNINNIE